MDGELTGESIVNRSAMNRKISALTSEVMLRTCDIFRAWMDLVRKDERLRVFMVGG